MRRHTIAALAACAGGLTYTTSKIILAVHHELGMHGFPAPPESYAGWQPGQITAAQLSNAAVGLLAALGAIALLRPGALARIRVVRRVFLGASWAGVAAIGLGVVGFGLRATGIAPGLGEPAIGWSAYLALAVGAGWVTSWAIALAGARRAPALPRSADGLPPYREARKVRALSG